MTTTHTPSRLLLAGLLTWSAGCATALGPSGTRSRGLPGGSADEAIAVRDAYDAGYQVGVAEPLIGWGAGYSAAGLLMLTLAHVPGGDDDTTTMDTLAGVEIGIGVVQLIAGIVLVVINDDARPDDLLQLEAYEAGKDVGWGAAMTGYGAVFLLGGIASAASMASEDGAEPVAYLSPLATTLSVAGTHLGFGIPSIMRGLDTKDRLFKLYVPGAQ